MSRKGPTAWEDRWARHYQDVWEKRSLDPRLPAWLRVSALAYGKHQGNGHAPFAQGQVSRQLGSVDPSTGELEPSLNVSRAIKTATRYGWLATGSSARCLVVPADAIDGGWGSPQKPCPVHGPRAQAA